MEANQVADVIIYEKERYKKIDIILKNSGTVAWPLDTYLVFAGKKNQLRVPQSTYVGMLEPNCRTKVTIKIKNKKRPT